MFKSKMLCIYGATLIFSTQLHANELNLAQAKQLLAEHKTNQAYQLLKQLEFEHAGNEEFDYLLGVAALERGRPNQATLAFERVLANNPYHLGARLDLARANFALGDYQRAEYEFLWVKQQQPPPKTTALINQYLDRISEHNQAQKPDFYLEFALGHDSNINFATDAKQVFIPAWEKRFTLDKTGQAASDKYSSISAGLNYSTPLNHAWQLDLGANGKQRLLQEHSELNTAVISGNASLTRKFSYSAIQTGISLSEHFLDDRRSHHKLSGLANWYRTLSKNVGVNFYGQYHQLRYVHKTNNSDLSAYNTKQGVIGGQLAYNPSSIYQLSWVANGYLSYEYADTNKSHIDGSQNTQGASLTGIWKHSEKLKLVSSLAYQQGKYQKKNPLLLDYRADTQRNIAMSLEWNPLARYTLKPMLSYTNQRSNYELSAYHKLDASINMRYDF